jgi:hypothetical protein
MLDAVPTDTITVEIDRRAVRAAVIDLRHETVLAMARFRDVLDRLEQRPSPAEVRDAPR